MTQAPRAEAGRTAGPPAPSWSYLWWAATGAILSFGVVSILTIGILLLPIGLALGVAGIVRKASRNESVIAVVGGLAAAPLYLAWLNREGPGTVCETLPGDVNSCADRWSPWPFLAVAAVLVVVTIIVAVRMRRAR